MSLEHALQIVHESQVAPPIPTIVVEMYQLLTDEQATAQDLQQLLKRDAGLSGILVHLANASHFQAPREIGTARQAIAFLGSDRVFELTACAWFCSVLPYRIPGYDVSAKSLWLHSIATAIITERLVSALQIKMPDLAFTAGLLHDVGKLVVGERLDGRSEAMMHEVYANGLTFTVAEQKLLATDHGEVGAALIASWGLPEPLVRVAGGHHSPNAVLREDAESNDMVLIDLVHVANALAHSLGFGADLGDLSRTIENDSMERLLVDKRSIDQAIVESVVNSIWEIGDLVAGGISC